MHFPVPLGEWTTGSLVWEVDFMCVHGRVLCTGSMEGGEHYEATASQNIPHEGAPHSTARNGYSSSLPPTHLFVCKHWLVPAPLGGATVVFTCLFPGHTCFQYQYPIHSGGGFGWIRSCRVWASGIGGNNECYMCVGMASRLGT